MKSKKKINSIVAFLILLLLTFIIFLILIYNRKDYIINDNSMISKKIDLKEKLNSYKEDKINVLHIKNNKIYGTVETDKNNSIIYSTLAIFTYDIAKNDILVIPQKDNIRVIDYFIIDNTIYYCILSSENNNKYEWKIVSTDLEENNFNLILRGSIDDVFEYPRIFAEYENSIYIVLKLEDDVKIIKVNNSKTEEIITIKGENINSIQMNTFVLYDNNIFFASTEEGTDKIRVVNVDEKNSRIIYQSNSKIKMIYTFNIIDEKIIVQEVLDQEKSNLITYNIDSKICENIIETEILTFPEMLNNNEILFHQPNNTWKKYLIEKNAFQNVEISLIDNNNVYPKYYLIDTNEILVQDYDNNFFVLSIN